MNMWNLDLAIQIMEELPDNLPRKVESRNPRKVWNMHDWGFCGMPACFGGHVAADPRTSLKFMFNGEILFEPRRGGCAKGSRAIAMWLDCELGLAGSLCAPYGEVYARLLDDNWGDDFPASPILPSHVVAVLKLLRAPKIRTLKQALEAIRR